MSRTYRRKVPHGKTELKWELREWRIYDNHKTLPTQIDPKSKEGIRRIARYHSDGGTTRFKEPGPAWYRNMTVERPQRRETKRQIHCWIRNEEFVVILNSKEPLDYWT
jgi:hypothetical protein